MAQKASNISAKGLGSINLNDFWKGALLTVFTSLLSGLYVLLSEDHFPTWIEFKPYVIAALAGFVSYILKNIGTNNVGQILKQDKPVVPVEVEKLEELKDKANS